MNPNPHVGLSLIRNVNMNARKTKILITRKTGNIPVDISLVNPTKYGPTVIPRELNIIETPNDTPAFSEGRTFDCNENIGEGRKAAETLSVITGRSTIG